MNCFFHWFSGFRSRRVWIFMGISMVGGFDNDGTGRIVQFCCVWICASISRDTTRCTFSFSQVNKQVFFLWIISVFFAFISTLLAVRFLGEKLNLLGKIGCLLTICGSVIIVIHAPKDNEVNSLLDFARKIGTPGKTKLNSFTMKTLFFRISFVFIVDLPLCFLFNHLLWSTIRF